MEKITQPTHSDINLELPSTNTSKTIITDMLLRTIFS